MLSLRAKLLQKKHKPGFGILQLSLGSSEAGEHYVRRGQQCCLTIMRQFFVLVGCLQIALKALGLEKLKVERQ